MKAFDHVSRVECTRKENSDERYRCWIDHGSSQDKEEAMRSEVDVDGFMVKGRSVVSGEKTEVGFRQAECRIYNGVLVCKDKDRWPDLDGED